MTTANRFEAIKQAVRAGDDQARHDAQLARARRRDNMCAWWWRDEQRGVAPDPRGAQQLRQERAA